MVLVVLAPAKMRKKNDKDDDDDCMYRNVPNKTDRKKTVSLKEDDEAV